MRRGVFAEMTPSFVVWMNGKLLTITTTTFALLGYTDVFDSYLSICLVPQPNGAIRRCTVLYCKSVNVLSMVTTGLRLYGES